MTWWRCKDCDHTVFNSCRDLEYNKSWVNCPKCNSTKVVAVKCDDCLNGKWYNTNTGTFACPYCQ